MSMLEYLKSNVPEAVLASRDPDAISAAAPPIVVPKASAIGKGAILSTLGLQAGNAFLDVIDTHPDYRHVKDIIARGDFDMSLPASQAGVQALVPGVLTQAQADMMRALGEDVVSVTEFDVRCAMWDASGNWLGG